MNTILVDARNFEAQAPVVVEQLQSCKYSGFDIETEDSQAHEGIKDYRKNDTAKVFDARRTTVCGFSIYTPGAQNSWYFNLAHADVENRIPLAHALKVLNSKPAHIPWIIHNVPFEDTMCSNSIHYDIGAAICTLQMAVSAFGPDEYPVGRFPEIYAWPVRRLLPEIVQAFRTYDPAVSKDLNTPQAEALAKVIAKESKAEHSYNGFASSIAYGYGLKKLVKSLFGYQMTTFQEALAGAGHMGLLTGEAVADYGGDDAYWAVQVFERLLLSMEPQTLSAFFDTENPMTRIYADIWKTGVPIKLDAVRARFDVEAQRKAELNAQLREAVHSKLPFSADLSTKLCNKEKWYADKGDSWRRRVEGWGNQDPKFNPTYYRTVRTILYDLCGLPIVTDRGKVQSDGEARGRLLEKTEDPATRKIISTINSMASVDQAIKLYLKPYQLLTDPETNRIYPVVSSKLATRRMASSFPNPMQLAKRGETVYIRGYYEADDPNYLIVSLDWSQVELVLIGEFSGDPEFAKAYGQVPYEDLHLTAACAILEALYDEPVTKENFKLLKTGVNPFSFKLVDEKGQPLTPKEAYSFNRGNPGGKGANFEYWYSAWLATLAQRRNLSPDQTQRLVRAYEERFQTAVMWRKQLISDAQWTGFVQLPDGHKRTKFEVTHEWQAMFNNFFGELARPLEKEDHDAVVNFGRLAADRIRRRGFNQLVNAMIQGTCATLAKRSRLRLGKLLLEAGLDATFMFPVHDELVWMVRKSDVLAFIKLAKRVMTEHPDIVKNLKLNASVSIGRCYEPFHAERCPQGQIELDEAPNVAWIPEQYHGKALPDEEILRVIHEHG